MKLETRQNSRREMGEKWEKRRNLRQKMGVNGKGEETRNIIFQQKTRNREKTGKNRGKNTKKQGKKTENNEKYRNKTRQDFSESRFLRDKISMRFQEMLKTKTRSS